MRSEKLEISNLGLAHVQFYRLVYLANGTTTALASHERLCADTLNRTTGCNVFHRREADAAETEQVEESSCLTLMLVDMVSPATHSNASVGSWQAILTPILFFLSISYCARLLTLPTTWQYVLQTLQ